MFFSGERMLSKAGYSHSEKPDSEEYNRPPKMEVHGTCYYLCALHSSQRGRCTKKQYLPVEERIMSGFLPCLP